MKKSEFYADTRDDLNGPLDGVTVMEITTTWSGPMAACVLADFGATVIKVEHPDGEVTRVLPPSLPDSDLTLSSETVNRNKQNLSLDLHKPEARRILLRLCENVDILIENFRPGVLDEWGLGYRDMVSVKKDIVYVSISGFGQFGPNSARAAYDPLIQHYSGWASLNGEVDGGPMKAPTWLGDDLAGLHGALGAMAALRHRDQTGEGQHVDVAMVDTLLFQSNGNLTAGALNIPLPRWGNQFGIAAPVNLYECQDGKVYAGVLLDSHWKKLSAILGREDLAPMNSGDRIGGRSVVDPLLADWCASRTVDEVVRVLTENGLPATPVNTYADVAQEEQIRSRDMLKPVELSDGTQVPLTAPPVKFSRTPTTIRQRTAVIGEHNESLLRSAGYSEEEIRTFVTRGIIGPTGSG